MEDLSLAASAKSSDAAMSFPTHGGRFPDDRTLNVLSLVAMASCTGMWIACWMGDMGVAATAEEKLIRLV